MSHSISLSDRLSRNLSTFDSAKISFDEPEIAIIERFVTLLKNIIILEYGSINTEFDEGLTTQQTVRYLQKKVYPLLVKYLEENGVYTEEDAECTSAGYKVAFQFKQYIKKVDDAERLVKILKNYFT
jgi:hypothetical protein